MDKAINLNLTTSERIFRYAAKFIKDDTIKTAAGINYCGGYENSKYIPVQFKTDDAVKYIDGKYVIANQNSDFPHIVQIADYSELRNCYYSDLIIYFPDYSVETYYNTHNYILECKTFINGCEVILYRGVIDRNNALANKPFKFFENTYYESIQISMLDPYYIMYDNDWEAFRQNVSNYDTLVNTNDYNDEGSLLYVTLTPVNKNDDGTYSTISNILGSSNVIPMGRYIDNALMYNVIEENGVFKCAVSFNNQYYTGENNTYAVGDLEEYLNSTYWGINGCSDIIQELYFYIMNEDGEYIDLEEFSKSNNAYDVESEQQTGYDYETDIDILSLETPPTWQDYREGFYFISEMDFVKSNEEEPILTIFSNKLPIPKEMFARCICEFKASNSEDILQNNNDEMAVNIVNQIVNQIVTVAKPDADNSKIITPIFIRVQNTSNIELHPNVNEYITINLDAYKNSVKTFILKIGECEFNENSRSAYGVTFKIIGSKLSNINAEGTYYILNQDKILVTTGNYKYIV